MQVDSGVTPALRSFIGHTHSYTEPFPIDVGMIRRFAEVLGDDDPLYFDEAHARRTAFGGIVAPPTLLFEWNHHDHGGIPEGARDLLAKHLGYGPATVRGGSEYTITQPLRPGDVITSSAVLSDVYRKEGRTGTLTFFVVDIAYTNQHGEALGSTRDTYIAPQRPKDPNARGGGTPDLAPRGELPGLVVEFTVEQFARYAAVAWDFAAVHYDGATAQALGYHAAFADAPMVTGILARLAKDWAGHGAVVRRIEPSYRGMMFPGDTLTCTGRLVGEHTREQGRVWEYEVWAANQEGRAVVRGVASVLVPAS
jgi:acyl dehydratase